MVDRIMEVANQRKDSNISKTLTEDVVWVLLPCFFQSIYNLFTPGSLSYRMFETHMDEYLDEEIEWVKHAFDVICKGWDQEASFVRDSVCVRGGVFNFTS
jgi:recyclin-1